MGRARPVEKATVLLHAAAPASTTAAVIQPTEPVVAVLNGMNTHSALDAYIRFQGERLAGALISVGHQSSLCDRIKKLKEGLTNRPLAEVGVAEIGQAVRYFTAQPISPKTKRPLSFVTVKELIKTLRAFFDWCDREGHWTAVRRWEDAFADDFVRNKMRHLKAVNRRRTAKGFDRHTPTELQIIWNLAVSMPFVRAMIGIGWWAGHTQQEIASLTLDDFFDEDEPRWTEQKLYGRHRSLRWLVVPWAESRTRRLRAATTFRNRPRCGC
jgi:hypothetical protein